jgi:hypothetical protein
VTKTRTPNSSTAQILRIFPWFKLEYAACVLAAIILVSDVVVAAHDPTTTPCSFLPVGAKHCEPTSGFLPDPAYKGVTMAERSSRRKGGGSTTIRLRLGVGGVGSGESTSRENGVRKDKRHEVISVSQSHDEDDISDRDLPEKTKARLFLRAYIQHELKSHTHRGKWTSEKQAMAVAYREFREDYPEWAHYAERRRGHTSVPKKITGPSGKRGGHAKGKSEKSMRRKRTES